MRNADESRRVSAKPVLAAIEGDAAAVVLGAKAGLQCPPQHPQALAEAVRRFYAMTPAERQVMGERGRRVVAEEYGRQRLVRRIADMLELAARSRRRR